MIKICRNPNGDTRTAQRDISFVEFQKANDMHINDVKNVMNELALMIEARGKAHDCTKKTHEKLFYDDFLSAMNHSTDFVSGRWYQLHIENERHHLLSMCPEDVNLLDVLETITDCVCAGIARSGEVRPIEIDDEILKKALNNTIELIKNMIE